MLKILTIVANTPLNAALLREQLADIDILAIEQRHDHVWDINCPEKTILSNKLRQSCYDMRCDFALQPQTHLRKKLLVSDMDSTIVVGETIDEMADILGISGRVSAITTSAMRGEIDFETALSQRLSLLKGLPRSTVQQLAENVNITTGAKQLLEHANKHQINSCLISGGFSEFTAIVASRLGFAQHIANQLSYDDEGRLDGHWQQPLVTAKTKLDTLSRLTKENDLSSEQTMAIGDGANDVDMIRHAGLGIAFYGKPVLRQAANAEIHSGSIDNAIWFI